MTTTAIAIDELVEIEHRVQASDGAALSAARAVAA